MGDYVKIIGRACNMVFTSAGLDGKPSQIFRSLLLQELIKRGVLGPSLVISYSHTDEDVDRTIDAFDGALEIYRQALDGDVRKCLVGPPSKVVYRRYN